MQPLSAAYQESRKGVRPRGKNHAPTKHLSLYEGAGAGASMSGTEDTGTPRKMKATCTNCGHRYTGATVPAWLEKGPDGYLSKARDDVSFRCIKGCDEVHEMDVAVLKRAEK